jgi:predicted ATPase
MVGRDDELVALLQLCDAVQAGVGRVALIVGDPGLGKTRLISEWKAAAIEGKIQSDDETTPSSINWIGGHCLSYGQGLAYHLITDLLRSIIRVPEAAGEPKTRAALLSLSVDLFGESILEVYPYLGHLLSLNLRGEALENVELSDPQALRTQYLMAFRRLFQALSTRRPSIIILEDLHWGDPSSIELLIELLPLVANAPILFCLVTRPERNVPGWKLVTASRELMGGSMTEIRLRALSEFDSQQLVTNILEVEALPSKVRGTILEKSDGNPLFVEEVIRMLIDQGAIIHDNGNWVSRKEIESVNIPDNLGGLLQARIDRLPDDVKHTLRVAAVIGRQFPKKVLARVLGEEKA